MNDGIFLDLLADRIDSIRVLFDIDRDHQLKGRRFNDTEYVIEAIQGAIIIRKNKKIREAVLKESMGLEYDPDQVMDGKYDPLIRIVLKHLSEMDYESENRIDMN